MIYLKELEIKHISKLYYLVLLKDYLKKKIIKNHIFIV